jgi:hypothetical protein
MIPRIPENVSTWLGFRQSTVGKEPFAMTWVSSFGRAQTPGDRMARRK